MIYTSAEVQRVPVSLPGRIGVWWFLASEIMVFGGLIASFVVFRLGGSGWHAEASHLSVSLAALITLILLSSSLTMVQAFAAAEDGNARSARMFLWLTILCGLGFLGVKAMEYSREIHEGFVPGSGLFWSFYYAMTGLNTLVLLASGWTMLRAKRRARAGARARATGALALTALLGAAFLGTQGTEWARLLRFGLSAPSGIYGGMFYAVVGAHAAHVLGALLWLLAVLFIGPLRRGAVAGGDGLSLLSLYWCFVVALWPFLYALLYLA